MTFAPHSCGPRRQGKGSYGTSAASRLAREQGARGGPLSQRWPRPARIEHGGQRWDHKDHIAGESSLCWRSRCYMVRGDR